MRDSSPKLSVIIPAYNEEQRLPRTVACICGYLSTHHPDAEVIVVDDGSQDATARIVAEWQPQFPGLRLVSNGRNRGKGYSVRHGMLEARGRVALFTDADLSFPIGEAEKLLAALEGADIAIGSRSLDRSLMEVRPPRLRELAGFIFNKLVQLFVGVRFRDTQCGLKAFVRERTQILFQQQRIEGWTFDPEILFLAGRYGLRVVEIPVRSKHDLGTKFQLLRDCWRMFLDLLLIRWNWLAGRYPRWREAQAKAPLLPLSEAPTAAATATVSATKIEPLHPSPASQFGMGATHKIRRRDAGGYPPRAASGEIWSE